MAATAATPSPIAALVRRAKASPAAGGGPSSPHRAPASSSVHGAGGRTEGREGHVVQQQPPPPMSSIAAILSKRGFGGRGGSNGAGRGGAAASPRASGLGLSGSSAHVTTTTLPLRQLVQEATASRRSRSVRSRSRSPLGSPRSPRSSRAGWRHLHSAVGFKQRVQHPRGSYCPSSRFGSWTRSHSAMSARSRAATHRGDAPNVDDESHADFGHPGVRSVAGHLIYASVRNDPSPPKLKPTYKPPPPPPTDGVLAALEKGWNTSSSARGLLANDRGTYKGLHRVESLGKTADVDEEVARAAARVKPTDEEIEMIRKSSVTAAMSEDSFQYSTRLRGEVDGLLRAEGIDGDTMGEEGDPSGPVRLLKARLGVPPCDHCAVAADVRVGDGTPGMSTHALEREERLDVLRMEIARAMAEGTSALPAAYSPTRVARGADARSRGAATSLPRAPHAAAAGAPLALDAGGGGGGERVDAAAPAGAAVPYSIRMFKKVVHGKVIEVPDVDGLLAELTDTDRTRRGGESLMVSCRRSGMVHVNRGGLDAYAETLYHKRRDEIQESFQSELTTSTARAQQEDTINATEEFHAYLHQLRRQPAYTTPERFVANTKRALRDTRVTAFSKDYQIGVPVLPSGVKVPRKCVVDGVGAPISPEAADRYDTHAIGRDAVMNSSPARCRAGPYGASTLNSGRRSITPPRGINGAADEGDKNNQPLLSPALQEHLSHLEWHMSPPNLATLATPMHVPVTGTLPVAVPGALYTDPFVVLSPGGASATSGGGNTASTATPVRYGSRRWYEAVHGGKPVPLPDAHIRDQHG